MSLPTKKFRVLNEGFVCDHCGKSILPTSHGTPRNHCPFCLYSKHVDVNPGDRSNNGRGGMKPIGVEMEGKRGYMIHHRCLQCHAVQRNRAVINDPQADDFEMLLELSQKKI